MVLLVEKVLSFPKALVINVLELFNGSALVILVNPFVSWLTILYRLFSSLPKRIYSPLYLLFNSVPDRFVSLSPFKR